MQTRRFFVVFLFFVASFLNAQPQPLTGAFRISTEDSLGRFACSSPRLYAFDSSSYIITWRDDRTLPQTVFAQMFNGAAQPVGNIFKLPDDNNIFLADKNTIVSFQSGSFISPYPIYGSVGYLAVQVQTPDSIIFPLQSVVSYSSGCIIIFKGAYLSGFKSGNGYKLFMGLIAGRYLSRIDSARSVGLTQTNPELGFGLKSFKFADNKYALITKKLSRDTLGYKMIAQLYSSSDSLLKDSIEIFDLNYNRRQEYNGDIPQIKTIALQNGDCFIAYMCGDTLYTTALSATGNRVLPVNKYFFRAGANQNTVTPYNIVLSTVWNNTFDLFVTATNSFGQSAYASEVFSFSTDGSFRGVTRQEGFSERLDGNLIKTGEGTYYYTTAVNNDIYLAQFSNYTFTPLRKVNNNSAGSNEKNGVVYAKPDGNLFGIWNDARQLRGRSFTYSGEVLNDVAAVPSASMAYYPSGNSLYGVKTANGKLLLKLYNKLMQLTFEDTLRLSTGTPTGITSCMFKPMSGGKLLLFAVTATGSFLATIDSAGSVLSDNTSGLSGTNALIYLNGPAYFIAATNTSLQKYDYQLQPIGPIASVASQTQVAEDVFAAAGSNGNPYGASLFVEFKRINGSKINYITLGAYNSNFIIKQIANNRLGVLYASNSKLVYTCLDSTGTVITPEFPVETIGGDYFNPSITVDGLKVIFSWSDNRGATADVFCKVYPIGPLVGIEKSPGTPIPSEYYLSAAYPNPFNPSTKFRYSVPHSGNVNITVYNTLGEPVKVIHNGYKTAGEYDAEFNAGNLSTGVYFIRLTAGNNTLVRKCLLTK